MGQQEDSDKVLHQDDVEEVISDQLDEVVEDKLAATSDHAAIADLDAPSATYVEAEAIAITDVVNEILDVLRDAKLIPTV